MSKNKEVGCARKDAQTLLAPDRVCPSAWQGGGRDVRVAAGIPRVTGGMPGSWQGCQGGSRDAWVTAGTPGRWQGCRDAQAGSCGCRTGTHQGLVLEKSVPRS